MPIFSFSVTGATLVFNNLQKKQMTALPVTYNHRFPFFKMSGVNFIYIPTQEWIFLKGDTFLILFWTKFLKVINLTFTVEIILLLRLCHMFEHIFIPFLPSSSFQNSIEERHYQLQKSLVSLQYNKTKKKKKKKTNALKLPM